MDRNELELGAHARGEDPRHTCRTAENALVGFQTRGRETFAMPTVPIAKDGSDRTRLGNHEKFGWGWGQSSVITSSSLDPAAELLQACMHVKVSFACRMPCAVQVTATPRALQRSVSRIFGRLSSEASDRHVDKQSLSVFPACCSGGCLARSCYLVL